jgi:hypothetical protein
MWAIEFNRDLIKTLQLKDLIQFLSSLLKQRHLQISQMDSGVSAKFYFWFDKQALQLRFNIISNSDKPLPFHCKVNIIRFPDPILQDFLITVLHVAEQGDAIEFLNSDNEERDYENEEKFSLDVYVKVIEQFEFTPEN